MKQFFLFLLLSLLILFNLQSQDWANSYNQSVAAYNNYNSEQALGLALTALSQLQADNAEPSKNLAAIQKQISVVYFDLGEEEKALEYAKETIRTLTITGDNTDLNFVGALQNLAALRMYRSEYGAAEPLLREVLTLTLNFQSIDDYETGVAQGNLGRALFHLKQDQEAGELFETALNTLQSFEEVGPDYFNIIYEYGSFLSENGQYPRALSLFEEMEDYYNYETPNFDFGAILIKVAETLDQLGRFSEASTKYQMAIDNFKAMDEVNSEEYSIALNNLSITLQKLGRFDEARNIIVELVAQRSGQQDSQPTAFANTLTNYANLLIREGEIEQAKSQLDVVISLYQERGLAKDLTYVNALDSRSGILLVQGESKEALTSIDEALDLVKLNNYSSKHYALLNQKAKILSTEARFEEAKSMALDALKAAQESFGSDASQTIYVKNTLAGILTQLGEYDAAHRIYENILPIFKGLFGETHPEYATIAANYSSLLQSDGDYYQAETYLRQAVAIKRSAFGETNPDYLTTYENLALLYLSTARYTEANRVLDEIRAVKEQITKPNAPSLAYTLGNLGNVKKQLADYTEAETLFKQALSIYRSSLGEQHIFYANAMNNLALLYQKMGNITAAKPLFTDALSIYESVVGKLTIEYATALENLATLYQMEDNAEEAKKLLEEVLLIDEQILGSSHPLYSKTLHNLASIYEKNGEYELSKSRYTEALDIERKVYGESHPAYASTLYNLAVLEQELENYDVALGYYEQVVAIRKNQLGVNHPDYTFSVYGLASIKHKTGDFDGAEPLYLEVTNKYLEYIGKYFPALSESEKGAFYGKIKPVFDSYLDFVVDYNLLTKGTEADRNELIQSMYNLQLSTKALLLNASNKVRNVILSSGDTELITLFNSWLSLKENIVKAYSMNQAEIESSQINIPQLIQQANEKEKQLSLLSASFAGEFENVQPTWTAVQGTLQSDEMALEMFRIKKKMKRDSVLYVGLLLAPGMSSPQMVVKANGLEMEAKGYKIYKNSITYKLQDKKSYPTFWKEFDMAIPDNVSVLYLSADGVINKVNIATLYNLEEDKYLIDKYNIRLLSNTKELIAKAGKENQQQDAMMFGFPKYFLADLKSSDAGSLFSQAEMEKSFGQNIPELPGTLAEIENIEKIIQTSGWTYNKFLGAQADEATLKKLKSPKILHIATHGFFLEDLVSNKEEGSLTSRNAKFNPLLRSGLLFAGAENTVKNEAIPSSEDGILTAYEAMNLNLDNTDIVVMSACETGLGEVKNGEGVYGLQRAFIVAGAKNLVMSLWKVNDETTQMLMSSFYKNWFGGKEKIDAFAQAIVDVRTQFPEPYYWGAFVILGK